jgi:rhamnulokinase
MQETYLAFDLGAESGRGILAEFDGDKIKLDDGKRFSTAGSITEANRDGVHRWDISRIAAEMAEVLQASEAESAKPLAGVAIDTWGVDFGLVSGRGSLLENPVWYRDHSHNRAMAETLTRISKEDLWKRSGIQLLPFNTLFQLVARRSRDAGLLERAQKLLFMPDLLSDNLITGSLSASELTIASTSQMLDPLTHQWNVDLLSAVDLPTHMLQPIVSPATTAGHTAAGTPVYFAPGHDTASAVAAVPADYRKNWAYISSGTWSLVGVERKRPELSLRAFELGLSNEIGVEGVTRLLKNIMGLWLVQESRRSLLKQGQTYGYEELTALASAAPCDGPIINAADQRFLAPSDMPAEIRQSCAETGQVAPATVGELIRCSLDSLALAYRTTLRDLERLLNIRFDVLHIVGGGSKNEFLNQLAADACGIPVIAGPSEATAAGNVLSQLVASGAVANWAEARQVCLRSFAPQTYLPSPGSAQEWLEREAKFLKKTEGTVKVGN